MKFGTHLTFIAAIVTAIISVVIKSWLFGGVAGLVLVAAIVACFIESRDSSHPGK